MKRLLITGLRQVSVDECAEPKCPAGGVLVRAQLTAISSGTELRVYRAQPVDEEGRYLHENVPFELPTENGYSMVGEVIACGGTVAGALGTPLSIGDRVFLAATHREMAVAPADSVFRVPDGIPSERAVLLNIVEVAHAALRSGAPHLGDDVAMVGQGVIGWSPRSFGGRTARLWPTRPGGQPQRCRHSSSLPNLPRWWPTCCPWSGSGH